MWCSTPPSLWGPRRARSILARACTLRPDTLMQTSTPSLITLADGAGHTFFGAGGRAMRLHVGAVQGHGGANAALLDEAGVAPLPDPAPAPAIEAVVDGRIRPVFARTFAPATTRLQHMADAAGGAAVVNPASAGLIAGPKGLDPRPCLVAQPEHPAHGLPAPTCIPDRIAAKLAHRFTRLVGFRA